MKTEPNCIFCKIISDEIPAYKVYEDDHFLAFLDIGPISLGHTLLIPKEHTEDFLTLSEELQTLIGPTLQKVTEAVKAGTNADGINITMNTGQAAGQQVFHYHAHIMPRFTDDGYKPWRNKKEYPPEEFKMIQQKISEQF